MKKYVQDVSLLSILVIFLVFIITSNYYVTDMVYYSINMWIKRIVPTLLPTFIIVDLFYNSNIPYLVQKYLHFNPLYIISIISGSPTNAYVLKEANNCEKALAVTKYTGFIFTILSLKNIFDNHIVLLLILFNILCNFILVLFIKPGSFYINRKHISFVNCFVQSIKNGMVILINILGFVIFFNILPINYIDNQLIKGILYSMSEVTTSFAYLSYTTLGFPIKLFLAIISMSSCGLCISLQIKSIISDTNFNYKQYIKYRLIHLILFLIFGLFLLI